MYVAIVGSREYPNRKQVEDYVNSLPDDTVIVSGGARGVDTWAQESAELRGLKVIVFPAPKYIDMKQFREGCLARNEKIVAKADLVIAFWDGKSTGTLDSMNRALRTKKNLTVIFPRKSNGNE